MPKVFVSYRRADNPDATGRLYDRLESRFGRESVFMDVDSIPIGVDFREYLDAAVGQCDVLLAIIGGAWLEQRRLHDPRDFVRIEIESALARGIPVVPVLVGRATMPGEDELPESLKRLAYRNAAEVRPGRDFGDHVARLIRGIEHVLNLMTPAARLAAPVLLPARTNSPGSFTNSIGMRFVLVQPGTFLMGSPPNEEGRREDEHQHEVTITKAFYLGVHQVTQGQWKAVMGNNPAWFSRSGGGKNSVLTLSDEELDLFPVECVSWEDAQGFLKKLTALDEEATIRREYRLPTEAEWEYACRGGPGSSPLPFHFAQPTSTLSSTQANIYGQGRTCEVGSYEPNPLGLYDMHGNVDEWCLDWLNAKYFTRDSQPDPSGPSSGAVRVYRGGCYLYGSQSSRAANRSGEAPSSRKHFLGFRVAAVPYEPRQG